MENSHFFKFRKLSSEILENNIIPFWLKYGPDNINGGFNGRVTNDLVIEREAPKSLILLTRILWTFSALYKRTAKMEYLEISDRAYRYLLDHFIDDEYGGAYWLVDYRGNPLNIHKKIYGQAFTIYALAEYFEATGKKHIMDLARNIFFLIEKHNFDEDFTGYFEMSRRDWKLAEVMQLSEADLVQDKSMNTHLHLLEAYTRLYQVWPDPQVELRLKGLISNFTDHIFNPENHHFNLYFNRQWESPTKAISFGHDIEGSWLLCEAVNVLDDPELKCFVEKVALDLVDAVIKDGFNEDGGIYSEKTNGGEIIEHIDWWQQAEAPVGFINAYMISGSPHYMEWASKSCEFTEKYFLDKKNGEWYYEVSKTRVPNLDQYKISEWKGPYHNSRACMEVQNRIRMIESGKFLINSIAGEKND